MSFKFRHLCDLLQALDDNRLRKNATSEKTRISEASVIISWFKNHEEQIPRLMGAATAFLSCLFPERRADRVYNIQEKRLENIVGRSLALGTTRMSRLRAWRTGDGADFAQTVQNVMSEAEFNRPRAENELTLEEIDSSFDRIAARYRGSSPDLRMRIQDPIAADQVLPGFLRRLQSVEAKWLVRMFLKNYSPVVLPETLVMSQYHCLLPEILRLQDSFRAAVDFLNRPKITRLYPRPLDQDGERSVKSEAAPYLKPQVGIMIQRAPYDKARSLQHCCEMAARRRISIERKYDGEYCQVHIDLSLDEPIKIFSKSGKDSTQDRVRLLGGIESALKLKKKHCLIKKQCILEGELVIWDAKNQSIQPFDKIRKHVSRNGRFIGIEQDSPADLCEKPMIVFYDLLLLDDIVCLNEFLEQRRSRLRSLIRRLPGEADLGYREKINFASADAKPLLRRAFARCISRGWEGFVLKGSDDPYFSLSGAPRCIKLKKDYIPGLGDVADLAIIGGRKDARDGKNEKLNALKWTTFYLACLDNGKEVRRFAERPRFRIVGTVSPATQTISPDRARLLNQLGQFERLPYSPYRKEMEVIMDLTMEPPTALFKNPFVVEAVGGGFDKPQGVAYHTLRFPRISRIHQDRSWNDITSFDGLQKLAAESTTRLQNEDSQEDSKWIQRLIQADPKSKFVSEYSPGNARTRDPESSTTTSTASASRPSQVSPPLVRVDTQELTGAERQARVLSDEVEISPAGLQAVDTEPLKRKRSAAIYSSSTDVSSKRSRLSEMNSGPSHTNVDQTRQSSLISAHSTRRQPLLEIHSASAALRSPNIPAPLAPQMQPGSSRRDTEISETIPQNIKHASTAAPREQVIIPSGTSSSRLERNVSGEEPVAKPRQILSQRYQQKTTEPVAPDPDKNMPSEQVVPSIEAVLPDVAITDREDQLSPRKALAHSLGFLRGCSPMIFLAPAMAAKIADHHHGFLSNLVATNVSFTFSGQLFLDSLQDATSTTHVVVVNIADHEGTGEEISKLHDSIWERLKRLHLHGTAGQVVFLDDQVLQLLRTDDSENTSIESLKAYFGGCLAWAATFGSGPTTGDDAEGTKPLQMVAVWDWDVVVDLVNRSRR